MRTSREASNRPGRRALTARSHRYSSGATISEFLPIVAIGIIALLAAINLFGDNLRYHGSAAASELAGGNGQTQLDAMPSRSGSQFGGPSSGGGGLGGSSGGDSDNGSNDDSQPSNSGAGSTSGGGGQVGIGQPEGSGNSSGSEPGASSGGAEGSGGSQGGVAGNGGSDSKNGEGDEGEPGGSVAEEEANLEKVVAYLGDLSRGMWDGLKTQFWDLVDFVAHPIEAAKNLKNLAVGLIEDFSGTMDIVIAELGDQFRSVADGDPYAIGKIIGENVSPAALANIAAKVLRLGKVAQTVERLDTACSSFASGTKVWSENGWTPIEQIRVGDKVWSRSELTFVTELQPVKRLMNRTVDHYYVIDTGHGSLNVTEEHPFWLQAKGWVSADYLKSGNAIAAAEGDILVKTNRRVKGPISVYNFSVEKNHTYFVSHNKIWVHNANENCTYDPGLPPKRTFDDIIKDIPESKRELFEADFENGTFADAVLDDPNLVKSWIKFESSGASDYLRTNPGALKAYITPKGSRPDPATYLDEVYIAEHLSHFSGGASRVVPLDEYERFGLGKPDVGKTEFVSTIEGIDKVLHLPVDEMAEALGKKPEQLQGGLVRIDFLPTDKIRLPNGREFSAFDEAWIPGGYTDGGVIEAVVETEGMIEGVDYIVTVL